MGNMQSSKSQNNMYVIQSSIGNLNQKYTDD